MQAFGHGNSTELSAADALKTAHDATPLDVSHEVFQDEHGIPLGAQVIVHADSFGTEPTQGELIAATRTRYSLRSCRSACWHRACAFPPQWLHHEKGRSMISDFKGKTAVLTGGASGFGLESARVGASLGMNVVLVDVQKDALKAAHDEIEAMGAQGDGQTGRCIER
jgi:hypothetical protein